MPSTKKQELHAFIFLFSETIEIHSYCKTTQKLHVYENKMILQFLIFTRHIYRNMQRPHFGL